MAVTVPENTNVRAASAQDAPNSNSQTAAASPVPPAAASGNTWSFHEKGNYGMNFMGRNMGSEVLGRLKLAVTDVIKEVAAPVEITLHALDRNSDLGIYFSVLVLAIRGLDNNGQVVRGSPVAYHTLIVEASNAPLEPIIESQGGTQIEKWLVSGDAYDQVLMNILATKMTQAFPGSQTYNAEACVVPRAFNTEDKNAVYGLVRNAVTAAATELRTRESGFVDLDLRQHLHDSTLAVELSFLDQQIPDGVGSPQRSSVSAIFKSSRNKNAGQVAGSVNGNSSNETISQLTGFIDFVWAPMAAAQNQYTAYANPGIVQPTQKYAARLVITSMESFSLQTPPAQLLSLVTALAVRDNNNWYTAFQNISRNKGINWKDVGALNYEARLVNGESAYLDTSGADFGDAQLGQLMAALCRQGLMFSMDIPECGPQTWCLSMFAAAASGGPGAAQAAEAIWAAANTLTGGYFGSIFPAGSPIFATEAERVHTGTYSLADGVERDLRDIDYLAMLNATGESGLDAIRDWSDTFTKLEYPQPQRLSARKKMIQALAPSAKFTGFATRVTFDHNFLEKLSAACTSAGLRMRFNTPVNANGFNVERGVAGYVTQGLMPYGQSSVFNQGGYNGAAAVAGSYQHNSRWNGR